MIIITHAKRLWRYLRETRAVAAMEYAIIVGVVVVGVGATAVTFSTEITDFLKSVTAKVSDVEQSLPTPPSPGP